MPLDPKQILKIDQIRMEGASAAECLEAFTKALGPEQGAEAFKEYANTPLKDGRLRSQVNFGDPHEWES